jgi:hypothetical protein
LPNVRSHGYRLWQADLDFVIAGCVAAARKTVCFLIYEGKTLLYEVHFRQIDPKYLIDFRGGNELRKLDVRICSPRDRQSGGSNALQFIILNS